MTRNKLLHRLEALEEIIKPKASEEIPPAAQEIINRMRSWKERNPESNTPKGENHEK
jgi:hypothetical protein